MNLQYFSNSIEVLLTRHEKTDNLSTADCLEGIAQCIRTIAKTDPMMGAIIWSGVKLSRGEASPKTADILDQRAAEIRLKNKEKSIVGVRR